MSLWSGQRLAVEIREKEIVTPFSDKNIDCAACGLHMGEEIFITPHATISDPSTVTKRRLLNGEHVAIPPGQFAFLLTQERVKMPTDVLGFISMRASSKFKGLINVSGFHVDPGYAGRLIFAVFNAGPSPIHIHQGERLFLLWLTSLEGPRKNPESEITDHKTKAGYENIPTTLVQGIPGAILSLQELSAKIDGVERRVNERLAEHKPSIDFLVFTVRAIGIGIIATVMIGLLSSVHPAINNIYNWIYSQAAPATTKK